MMNPHLAIRLARPTEQAELESLLLRASLSNLCDRDAIRANLDAITVPIEQIAAGLIFVAERDGQLVGFASVQMRADSQMEIDGLFVDPKVWRNGIGTSLIDWCVTFAIKSGSTIMHVVANPHAEGFYVSYGFRRIGLQNTRLGVGILMCKSLDCSAFDC